MATDIMTLTEYARSVKMHPQAMYARVNRRIARGDPLGMVVRPRGFRLLSASAEIWRELTKPLPRGRPRKDPPRTQKRRKK